MFACLWFLKKFKIFGACSEVVYWPKMLEVCFIKTPPCFQKHTHNTQTHTPSLARNKTKLETLAWLFWPLNLSTCHRLTGPEREQEKHTVVRKSHLVAVAMVAGLSNKRQREREGGRAQFCATTTPFYHKRKNSEKGTCQLQRSRTWEWLKRCRMRGAGQQMVCRHRPSPVGSVGCTCLY